MPGGFLGVDIFFVISGFVITASLFRKNNKNFFEFITKFYERRIKRLIPPLLAFVLLTTIITSLFIIEPTVLDDWLTSLDDFAKRILMKNVKVVIYTPTPEFPIARLKQCKTQNSEWFNQLSKKDCFYPKSFFSNGGVYTKIINALENISNRNRNLYLFDALDAMCQNSICKYQEQNEPLYSDDDHISDYSARYIIAPKMLKFLKNNVDNL